MVGAPVTGVRGLRDGGSPWLLEFEGAAPMVLRPARPGDETAYRLLRTEVAVLPLLEELGIAAPRLVAADLEEHRAVLITVVPGSSAIPAAPVPERLRAMGAFAAGLHAVPFAPRPDLPRRERPIEGVDFVTLHRAEGSTPLLDEAHALLGRLPRPEDRRLVHGDLWQGNVLWAGDTITGVIDWDCAGSGHPGVDLGSLRSDAAIAFGPEVVDEVLDGWTAAGGEQPRDTAYFDAVAAVNSPADLGYFLRAYAGQGRDLDPATAVRNRDAFLATALERLPAP